MINNTAETKARSWVRSMIAVHRVAEPTRMTWRPNLGTMGLLMDTDAQVRDWATAIGHTVEVTHHVVDAANDPTAWYVVRTTSLFATIQRDGGKAEHVHIYSVESRYARRMGDA
jgi:hypothetical protein